MRIKSKNIVKLPKECISTKCLRNISSVQSLSCVQLFATSWTVAHQEFTQTHFRRVCDAIQPSHHLSSLSPPTFTLSQHQGLFQWVSFFFFFASSGQSIRVSASASVLPMNIQDWFLLGWTGWIFLLSKGLSRVFSNTTVQKHQFFSAQLSSQSNSHIHTWLLEKPETDLSRQSNVSAFEYTI